MFPGGTQSLSKWGRGRIKKCLILVLLIKKDYIFILVVYKITSGERGGKDFVSICENNEIVDTDGVRAHTTTRHNSQSN